MNFGSDNVLGAWPEMVAALEKSSAGSQLPYGDDQVTARLETRFREVFERSLRVFPVISGTAANALSLSTLVAGHGAVLCPAGSHIARDECGATEFFTHGARVVTLPGRGGEISPPPIQTALAGFFPG